MGQRLNAIAYSMGFTKSMSPEELLSLSKWIKEQFGDMAMQEVALAFDLVTAKKIGNDIKHYATFSKQYIGEVLNVFRTHRAKQIKLADEHEKQKQIMENKNTGATPEEMYNTIKKIALEQGTLMKIADWTGAYSHAWKEKLIHRMNKTERTMYKEGVIEDLQTEGRAGFHSKPVKEIIGNEHSLVAECYKRIMHVHFQEIIDTNQTS